MKLSQKNKKQVNIECLFSLHNTQKVANFFKIKFN